VKADFSRSQQAMSKARQKGVARFLPNPGALPPAGRLRGVGGGGGGSPLYVLGALLCRR
jgi:hypothetical protein